MPRLFFAGDIGDMQRLQVQYASECKVPNERGKKALEGACKSLLGSKAKPLVLKFAKKCLDTSNL